jgi:hypothetical protein
MAVGIKSRDWAQAPARCTASSAVLGAALNADDVETPGFVVGLSIAGQLHEQISDLLPGTRVSGLILAGDST